MAPWCHFLLFTPLFKPLLVSVGGTYRLPSKQIEEGSRLGCHFMMTWHTIVPSVLLADPLAVPRWLCRSRQPRWESPCGQESGSLRRHPAETWESWSHRTQGPEFCQWLCERRRYLFQWHFSWDLSSSWHLDCSLRQVTQQSWDWIHGPQTLWQFVNTATANQYRTLDPALFWGFFPLFYCDKIHII